MADPSPAHTPAGTPGPATPAPGPATPSGRTGTPRNGSNGASGTPSNVIGTPGNVVHGTPGANGVSGSVGGSPGGMVVGTPGSHRRELGVSSVRLTPGTPGAVGAEDGEEEMVLVWGTNINFEDVSMRLGAFVEGFMGPAGAAEDGEEVPLYMSVLAHIADTGGTIVNIDMAHLNAFDQGMYTKVVQYPNELITIFDNVVSGIFAREYPEEALAIDERRRQALHVRTYNLLAQDIQSMRDLNPKNISSMVAVRGMVIRASPIVPDIQRAMYRCGRCQYMREAPIVDGRIDEPRLCEPCKGKDSFSLQHSRSAFADKQMMRLQESPEAVPKGETPATFTLVMYDNLVDVSKPGDRVEITGILRAAPVRVNPRLRTVRSVFRTYIDCIHVRTLNNNQARAKDRTGGNGEPEAPTADGSTAVPTDPLAIGAAAGQELVGDAYTVEQREAREKYFDELSCHPTLYDRLANSLAPSIFGMTDEKKGVLLQLFGGASKSNADQANGEASVDGAARFRSAINVLLVGDPGTSKSQLLQCAHRLAPRGVYTSGRGSSAVGLTAYVTRDPDTDDYVLESGALVLSDRGVCCIDEFDKMSDFARSVLHEAMEQQTVSIAKAGIIATLNARTAVLAAANPVNSRYDTNKSVVDNIDLPPTLLSRFDLIYLVLDAPNAESDRRLAQHIVSLFYKNYDEEPGTNGQNALSNGDEDVDLLDVPEAPEYGGTGSGDMLDAKTLTEYIAYSRTKVDPRLSSSAAEALVNGYIDMRAGGRGGANITATPRQLESLIRLAEAHARMQLKEEVDDTDVSEAIRLVKAAMHMAAFDPTTGKIDMNLFTAGVSRAAQTIIDALANAAFDKLRSLPTGDVTTVDLLDLLRETSDVDITPSNLRDALRRLKDDEKVSIVNNGKSVRLMVAA